MRVTKAKRLHELVVKQDGYTVKICIFKNDIFDKQIKERSICAVINI